MVRATSRNSEHVAFLANTTVDKKRYMLCDMIILRNILRFSYDNINTLISIMICEFQNYFWILFCNEQLAVLCILFLTLYSYAQFNT